MSQSDSPLVDELLAERRAEAEREELAELSFWAAIEMLDAERWDRLQHLAAGTTFEQCGSCGAPPNHLKARKEHRNGQD